MTTLHSIREHGHGLDPPAPAAAVCTGTFDAIGQRFAVECDASMALLVEHAFAALAVDGEPTGWYRIRHTGDTCTVDWRGETLARVAECADALSVLRQDVNRRAIAAADHDLVLHAGAVALGDAAVVIGGPPRCGKSTLVAALVAEGGIYLADDIVPVALHAGSVRAFPHPAALDDVSLDLLPEMPALRTGADETGKRVVALRTSPVPDDPLPVAMVVFPQVDRSGLTILQPLPPGEAIVRLAERCFNFPSHGRDAIATLARLTRAARLGALVMGDPRSAARLVLDAVASRKTSSHQGHHPVIECARAPG